MTEPVFEPVDVPAEDYAPESNDPTCVECGAPLTYSGRGRKPRYCDAHRKRSSGTSNRASSPRASGNVDTALVILGGMYDGLSAALMMLSPRAATEWSSRVDTLQMQNRVILTANPDLCKRINNVSKSGATGAFIAAHVMAVAPVVAVVRQDMGARKVAKQFAESGTEQGPDIPTVGGIPWA